MHRRLLPLLGLAPLLLASSAARADTVIVKYRTGRSHAQADRRAGVIRTVGRVQGQGARVVAVRGDAADATRALNRSPGVRYAEPNARLHVLRAPHDPLYTQMGGLALVHAEAGWATARLAAFGSARSGVPVGIVDTGIDAGHEDLAGVARACATASGGRVMSGGCADDNGHGTHVAGTIGAIADNGVGITGLAFSSPLVICKALGGAEGAGSLSDVANCIRWVHLRGAKVISLSLGGGASTTLRTAVRDAWKSGRGGGSLIVAAAGNDGDTETSFPAGYDEVVSVAAVDDRGHHATFSNENPDVEIAAPGVDVLLAKLGGGYVRFSGTSMATPHVAAAAALLWGAHRRSSPKTIRTLLDAHTTDTGAPGRDPVFGFGVLDLAR